MPLIIQIAVVLAGADPTPPIVALAVAPSGAQVLTASQAGVQVRSLPDLKVQRTLATKLEHVHDLAFSPRGDVMAIAGGSPGERGAVEFWEWPAGRLKKSISAGDDVAYHVAFSGDGMQLAIACADKTVRVQPVDGSSPTICRPHSAAVLAVVWLPADDLVLSAGVDQTIRLITPATGETIRSLENHTAAVRDLAVRPGGQEGPAMVASAGADRTVRFWQPTIGRLVRFARLPIAPTAICWTPNGLNVLAACEDGRLRAIDPVTVAVTELAATIDGLAYAVAVVPEGNTALLGGERGQLRRVPLDAIKP